MDISVKEFVQILFTVFASGIATYTAIKADLSDLKARVKIVEQSNDKAHERLDDVLMDDRRYRK